MRKQIYIKNKDVLEYLEKQLNQSAYIVELIKKDMKNEGLSEEVKQFIVEYINKSYNNLDIKDEESFKHFKSNMQSILDI